jgi:hypothetical protein
MPRKPTLSTNTPKNPELTERVRLAYNRAVNIGLVSSVSEANKLCGFANATIDDYLQGRRKQGTPESLAKIAKGLQVSSFWLEKGIGSMELDAEADAPIGETDRATESRVVYTDRYPNREVAISIYESIAPPQVIRAVRSIALKSQEDPPYREWCDTIEKLIKERKRAEAGQSIDTADLDLSLLD